MSDFSGNNNQYDNIQQSVINVYAAKEAPLPDNVFQILVAIVANEFDDENITYNAEELITIDSVVKINTRDPAMRYAIDYNMKINENINEFQAVSTTLETIGEPTVYTNNYTGSIFVTVHDYLRFYRMYNENNADLGITALATYAPGKKLKSSLQRTDIVEQLNRASQDVAAIVQDATSLVKYTPTMRLELPIDTEKYNMVFGYTDLTRSEVFTLDTSILTSNCVLVASQSGSKLYEDLPNLDAVIAELKIRISELQSDNDLLYILRHKGQQQYVVALYRYAQHAITLYSQDRSYEEYLPQGFVEPLMVGVMKEWNIYLGTEHGLDFNLLLHAITTRDPEVFALSLDERKVYFLSKQPWLVYTSPSGQSYHITVTPNVTMTKFTSEIRDFSGDAEDLYRLEDINAGTYYVTISTSTVENNYVFESMVFTLSATIMRFINVLEDLREIKSKSRKHPEKSLQNRLVDKYTEAFSNFQPRYSWLIQSDQKLRALQNGARSIFVKGYAKRCQKQNQGVLISPKDVDTWKQDYPNRSMITYPKDKILGQPQIIYGCPDERFPHACLKANHDLSNKEEHPFVPCCCADDPKLSRKSAYNRYYYPSDSATDEERVVMSSSKTMSSNTKLLRFGQRGDLPQLPESFLLEKGFKAPIGRFGVFRSINSIIHCLFWAVQDEDYISRSITGVERAMMVEEWRKNVMITEDNQSPRDDNGEPLTWFLRRRVHPAVVYQELYDNTDEDIRQLVGAPHRRFDSALLYRILEAYFNVNIFVFEEANPKARATLEIPRNKVFHIREQRFDRPSVLLYKHMKSEEDLEPHYELINIDGRVLMGRRDSVRLFDLFTDLYRTFIFTTSGVIDDPYSSTAPSIRSVLVEANFTLHGQYVDQYGKGRGYYVSAIVADVQVFGTVACYPQQLLDLPIYKSVTPFPHSIVTQLFPKPTAKSLDNGVVTGLWFSIAAYERAMYVPIVEAPVDAYVKLQQITANPLVLSGESPNFHRYIDLEKRVTLFLEFFTTLYRHYGIKRLAQTTREVQITQRNKQRGQTQFIEEGITLTRNQEFAVALTDWSTRIVTVPGSIYILSDDDLNDLNASETWEDAVEIAVKVGLMTQTRKSESWRIVVPTAKLNLDLTYYSSRFLQHQPLSFYTLAMTNGGVAQFQSFEELEIWAQEQGEAPRIINNATEISATTKKPIYYYDDQGGLFIVQNVAGGNRDAAVRVSYNHHNTGINLGYNAARASPEMLLMPIKVYQVAGSSILTYNATAAPAILQLRDSKFAALIRLTRT